MTCIQVGTKLAGREELKAEWERFQKQRVCSGVFTEETKQHGRIPAARLPDTHV